METAGLRDGMKADLVVFNSDTVRATATFEDPKQFPVGIDHVLVNGQLVVHNGSHTGRIRGGHCAGCKGWRALADRISGIPHRLYLRRFFSYLVSVKFVQWL